MEAAEMDFMKTYEELKARRFPVGETLDFSVALGENPDIALHFELYCIDQRNPRSKRAYLEDHFDRHGQEGMIFLKNMLDNEDEEKSINAAYLMAEFLPKRRWNDKETLRDVLVRALIRLSDSESAEVRRKSIIALGWTGDEKVIPLLSEHLINDPDSLCRAWSASSFLQMNGRVENEIMRRETKSVLLECLESEQDVFVCGVAAETVGDIWKKRFGLSGIAVENRDAEAVEKARRRVIRFLNKTEE